MTLPCAILCGGRGARLGPLTDRLPKSLVPVRGRPFVDWQLELLAGQGVTEVVLCAGHRGDQLRAHVGDGSRWGLRARWVDDGPAPRGTAGALRLACDGGALGPAFLVLYGDSYLCEPVGAVEAAWRASGAPALMTVLRNDGRWDRSNAVYESGRVVSYEKRAAAPEMRWIDYGLSVLGCCLVRERVPAGAFADLADLMHVLSGEGLLAGFEVAARFYEIGSPAGLRDLEAALSAADDRS